MNEHCLELSSRGHGAHSQNHCKSSSAFRDHPCLNPPRFRVNCEDVFLRRANGKGGQHPGHLCNHKRSLENQYSQTKHPFSYGAKNDSLRVFLLILHWQAQIALDLRARNRPFVNAWAGFAEPSARIRQLLLKEIVAIHFEGLPNGIGQCHPNHARQLRSLSHRRRPDAFGVLQENNVLNLTCFKINAHGTAH